MSNVEGRYYWARVSSETDKYLMVEQVTNGFFLMGTDKLYDRSEVELLSLPLKAPFDSCRIHSNKREGWKKEQRKCYTHSFETLSCSQK